MSTEPENNTNHIGIGLVLGAGVGIAIGAAIGNIGSLVLIFCEVARASV